MMEQSHKNIPNSVKDERAKRREQIVDQTALVKNKPGYEHLVDSSEKVAQAFGEPPAIITHKTHINTTNIKKIHRQIELGRYMIDVSEPAGLFLIAHEFAHFHDDSSVKDKILSNVQFFAPAVAVICAVVATVVNNASRLVETNLDFTPLAPLLFTACVIASAASIAASSAISIKSRNNEYINDAVAQKVTDPEHTGKGLKAFDELMKQHKKPVDHSLLTPRQKFNEIKRKVIIKLVRSNRVTEFIYAKHPLQQQRRDALENEAYSTNADNKISSSYNATVERNDTWVKKVDSQLPPVMER